MVRSPVPAGFRRDERIRKNSVILRELRDVINPTVMLGCLESSTGGDYICKN